MTQETTDATRQFRYQEIAEHLKGQIEARILQPGERVPSLRELRRVYGITQGTVEKAHDLLEKEGLIVRSHRNGVFVAEPRQKLRTGLIGFCGVAFTRTDFSAYWARVMEGAENAARECDAQIVLLSNDSPSGWDKVDGLLLNSLNASVPAQYVPAGLPIVSLFYAPPKINGTSAERNRVEKNSSVILIDDYGGAHAATEHLVKLGHRRIAYLTNRLNSESLYAARIAGYHDALTAAGIAPDPQWLRALPSPSPSVHFMGAGRLAMQQWLREDWKSLGCTALLAHNDDTAWGVVEAFREAGISVPGEVSVVGYDGTEVAECCTPELTTVEVPLTQMGRAAVELLWQQINGKVRKSEIVLPTQLRVRASSAPCA